LRWHDDGLERLWEPGDSHDQAPPPGELGLPLRHRRNHIFFLRLLTRFLFLFYKAVERLFENVMDWAKAIERNTVALVHILAGLLDAAGYADGAIAARLPGPIHRAALRVLRPMESAVRRLIVIAARNVVVKPPRDRPKRPMPEGFAAARKAGGGGGRVPPFRLFDTRKRFDLKPRRKQSAKGGSPRIWSFEPDPPPISAYLETGSGWGPVPFPLRQPVPVPPPAPVPRPEADGTVSALGLGRRLAAVKMALADIPRQAVRLKRWQMRRERIKLLRPAIVTSPLRPGRPPGLRKRPKDDVERILRECHDLAFDALRADTS
jgi:hypothetical protein